MIEAITCLALNIYFESRNQPIEGQVAVSQVVLERVKSKKYPNTVCEVVFQGPTYSWSVNYPIRDRCQFSWYCDGLSDKPKDKTAWLNSLEVAEKVYYGLTDTVKGATHYHSVKVDPWWAKYKVKIKQIGDHIFYR
jgi:spore germination cell wall hydrolase CwlJ-like protein